MGHHIKKLQHDGIEDGESLTGNKVPDDALLLAERERFSQAMGMVETELFAQTYKSYGLATVRYPVLEVTATVEPFKNGRGFAP